MKELLRILLTAAFLSCLVSCSVFDQLFAPEDAESWPSTESLMDRYKCRGTLEEMVYKCSVPGPSHRRMLIYLPENYYKTSERYPVLYLFHGARGNETSWITKGDILPMIDSLRYNDLAKDFIIVFTNMNQYNDDKDFGKSRFKTLGESYVDINGAVESSFMRDVVKNVDNHYRTVAEKGGRAIAGLSFGAFQAMYISAHYPDEFDYIGLFSPCYRAPVRNSPYSDFYNRLMRKMRVQFEEHKPELYIVAIGYWDVFYNHVEEFRRKLDMNDIEYEYIESGGGHGWENWKAYADEFCQRLF